MRSVWRSYALTVQFILAGIPALAGAQGGAAPAYPTKPIRLIVPYPPSGISDRLARQIGQKLGASLGQTVVVENRPGGSTNIGSELVARAAPDGYVLLMSGIANAVAPALYPKLSYDPIRDLACITNLTKVPLLLVAHPSLPVRNAGDIVAIARSKPGYVLYASSGIATSGHLAGELFNSMTGVKLAHVPYKGAAQALLSVVPGEVALYFGAMASPLPHVRTGRLRAIGVTTVKRSPAAPEVPSLDEQGLKGFDFSTWYSVSAPGATPKEVVAKLNGEIVRIIKLPEVREQLASEGADFVGDTPEEFTVFFRSETARWAKVVKAAGIKAD